MPPHSTENHVARAFRSQVGLVEEVQESDPTCWMKMAESLREGARPDFILWTRTNWDRSDQVEQMKFLLAAQRANVPVIGYHLDIWWGLARQHEVYSEPFFTVDLLITADGGHDAQWADIGANHVWFPPAVSAPEAVEGFPLDRYRSTIAFVGSHDGGYHQEHQHRHELIGWLRTNFRNSCRFFPEPGQPGIRGQDLQDLYASVDVVVGDSAFAGSGLRSYVSDRVPETIGRGGFLLHPRVPGVTDGSAWGGAALWTEGETIACWSAGDWDELGSKIDHYLSSREERREIAAAGRAHVLAHHTYEIRMQQLMELLIERGLIR